MNTITLYEEEEFGKDYIIIEVSLDDLDSIIPGFIRTAIENTKSNHKFVKVIIHDIVNTEIEYFENSVRSNKKGAAYIDRNGRKHFYIMGKQSSQTEQLQNMDRSKTLKDIL
jgi:hypothetical protein